MQQHGIFPLDEKFEFEEPPASLDDEMYCSSYAERNLFRGKKFARPSATAQGGKRP